MRLLLARSTVSRRQVRSVLSLACSSPYIKGQAHSFLKPNHLHSKPFSSSIYSRMPITELVFPTFKHGVDAEPIVARALSHFDGVKGLLMSKAGQIVQANGAPVSAEKSSILILEWEEEAQFHDFYKSEIFAEFGAMLKPVAAAPAIPELFEADTRSIQCTSAAMTQIIKLKVANLSDKNAIETAWENLVHLDGGIAFPTGNVFRAWGVKNVEGEFLGMIGWDSLEAYHSAKDNAHIKSHIEELGKHGVVTTLSVQYPT